MIKMVSGCLCTMMVILCGCQTRSQYIVNGHIAGYSGEVFLLSPDTTDELDTLARADVRDGVFQMTGNVKEPTFAWLIAKDVKLRIPLFLENTSFDVNVKGQPAVWSVSGGDLQQARVLFKNEVENVIKEKRDSLEKVYQKCVQEKNLFGEYHVRALAEELDSIYESKENEFIQNNNNIVAASLIYARLFALNKNKMLREKYELLGDSARNTTLGNILTKYVENEVDLRKGALFPDFTLQTPQGESVSLYSVKAKVKIIDFWASWCGPCRAENPHVKELYEKYHDKGLEVISVSLDDKKDKWLKAIEQDGLPWIHVSDLQAWGNPLVKMLGIQGIPYLVVLDKDNRIVGTRLRGEQLDRCVMEAIR
ncbi:redoxin family protein [Butyricimonas sp. RTP31023st2_F12_RTP31023_210422]|uniref:redoxin family protein n=1 Tax=Butyricimonas sp. RTP31023st2_F12_RTP31023_210422 TaxID=3143211 RepID=UPI0034A4A181